MKEFYLGAFDIGGTKITAVVADLEGRVSVRLEEPVQTARGEFAPWEDGTAYYGLAAQAGELLQRTIEAAGIERVTAIGIGSAGPLNEGAIKDSTNIEVPAVPAGLAESPLYIPLVEPLASQFDAPVTLENDCNTAVIAEVYYGVGKEVADKSGLHLVYVTLSTGFGAGVWTGGHLLRGKEGNAAEVGHFVVKEEGLKCGCGNYGCAEAYCSGSGIVKNARIRLVNEGWPLNTPLARLAKEAAVRSGGSACKKASFWQLLDFISTPLVFEAAAVGDGIAQEVLEEACHYGGIALANIANAYDPDVITVGGSIAINHPDFVTRMQEELLKHLNVTAPEVRITPLGERAVEYGAIALAKRAAEEGG